MKIVTDPLPVLKQAAVVQINAHFSQLAGTSLHTDHAHARKLETARRVLGGEDAPEPFVSEASRRGVTVVDLANTVIRKANAAGDSVLQREWARQEALLEVDAVTSPDELRRTLRKRSISWPFGPSVDNLPTP